MDDKVQVPVVGGKLSLLKTPELLTVLPMPPCPVRATPQVTVVLATWNGHRFLPVLLDSLATQDHPPDLLLVGDDGSTDGTVELVLAWAAHAPFPVQVLPPIPTRLGPVGNFARLLAAAPGAVVLCCDQDDRWAPGKIRACLAVDHPSEPRALVHDLRLIDAQHRVLGTSFWTARGFSPGSGIRLTTLVVQCSFPGCALAVNRPLLDQALPLPQAAISHDWWLELVAAACGRILVVSQPLVDYRQHASNAVGAGHEFRQRLLRLLRGGDSPVPSQAQARALTQRLPRPAPLALRWWAVARRWPWPARVAITLRLGIAKTGFLRHLLMLLRS